MKPTTSEINSMLAHLESIFRGVRSHILEYAGNIAHEEKSDGSPVTEIDSGVEKIVISSMLEIFPNVAVYGEESGYSESVQGIYWLIDPIDGTQSFIDNIPTFTNMAVLISNNEAIASLIYNPSTDELFTAIKGEGAFKNGARLTFEPTLKATIALCKGRDVEQISYILRSKEVKGFVAPDGAGNAFAMVADGIAAAKFSLHSKGGIHDYAPGALLVSEAGGDIIPILDEKYRYDTKTFIACHPSLTDTITTHIEEIRNLEN